MDRRLVDHLVNSNLVSRAAMQRMILRATKEKTGLIEQVLADDKIDEKALAHELAQYFGFGEVEPAKFSVNETALKFISKTMADKHGVLPFAASAAADHVTVAVYNPEAARSVVDSLKTATGKEPTVLVAPRTWLTEAIRHFYFGEPWAAAPAHQASTREVAEVMEQLEIGNDPSSEIVLDEVVVPPAPRPKAAQKAAPPEPQPEPAAEQIPEPRRRKTSAPPAAATPPPAKKSAQTGSPKPADSALDEFDAFLNSATGWGNNSRSSGIPGWDEAGSRSAIPGWDDVEPVADNGWEERAGSSGFNLFDEQSEAGVTLSVRELLDAQERTIERLRDEMQQQQDIIRALVDALVDAGVVTKRDIKNRAARK